MLDGGSLASHSSQHVGRSSRALSHHKDLIVDVSGYVLKGVTYLQLTLWLLRDVCCKDRGSLPQSARQWWQQLKHLYQRSTSNVGRNEQLGVLDRVYQTMPYLSPN